ncbi:Dimer-Tnp-hAT domain containing protein, partial [Pyrenophora tritici-repentis]
YCSLPLVTPYYKYYCDNSWADKPEWLNTASAGFQRLWQTYKPQHQRPLTARTSTITIASGIDDVIGAFIRRKNNEEADEDEYERWKTQEPEWSREQYLGDGHPVVYWIQMRSKYPCLSQFAIDILTIPASSSDCERLFSELGDLLEPKRRAIGSELLAALHSAEGGDKGGDEDDLSDEDLVRDYNIQEWIT